MDAMSIPECMPFCKAAQRSADSRRTVRMHVKRGTLDDAAALWMSITEHESRHLRAVLKERFIVEQMEHESGTSARWNGYRSSGYRTNLNTGSPIGLQ